MFMSSSFQPATAPQLCHCEEHKSALHQTGCGHSRSAVAGHTAGRYGACWASSPSLPPSPLFSPPWAGSRPWFGEPLAAAEPLVLAGPAATAEPSALQGLLPGGRRIAPWKKRGHPGGFGLCRRWSRLPQACSGCLLQPAQDGGSPCSSPLPSAAGRGSPCAADWWTSRRRWRQGWCS